MANWLGAFSYWFIVGVFTFFNFHYLVIAIACYLAERYPLGIAVSRFVGGLVLVCLT